MFRKLFGRRDDDDRKRDESAAAEAPSAETSASPAKAGLWARFKKGLSKTREGLKGLFGLRRAIDDSFIDELDAALLRADFGPALVEALIHGENGLRAAWKERKVEDPGQVREYLKSRLKEILKRRETRLARAEKGPTVVLVAGVNGTGKTTTIAKLAHLLKREGHTVLLAAGDTFRAAAVEQLTIWSRRIGIDIVTGEANQDPAAVVYRAADAALAAGTDYLIVDTAGRLHTQKNLMRELAKVRGVLAKKIAGAPHEALLVLDATVGQNALSQARSFLETIEVSGIVLTKLDGTAKGGIVVTINNDLDIPVKFVGVGEQLDDLEPFDADSFVDAILSDES